MNPLSHAGGDAFAYRVGSTREMFDYRHEGQATSRQTTTRRGWRAMAAARGPALAPIAVRSDIRWHSALLTAGCSHGNRPPSVACKCGIHYMCDVEEFFDVWSRWIAETASPPLASLVSPMAYGFGYPLGLVRPDPADEERAERSEMFVITHLILPTVEAGVRAQFANLFGVPVTAEWSIGALRTIAAI